MKTGGATAPSGDLGIVKIGRDGSREPVEQPKPKLHVVPGPPPPSDSLWTLLRRALPSFRVPLAVSLYRIRNFHNVWRGLWRIAFARAMGLPHMFGTLYIRTFDVDGNLKMDYGLVSLRVVTTAGVNAIVDAFQNLVELETFKYHAIGTGTNAEATSDTALQTELATEYNPDNTRATGSLGEGASANIFRTVGTNTFDGSVAATEHGILTQAATGGGTLLDRTKFSVINLGSGEGIETTYDFTVTAGG